MLLSLIGGVAGIATAVGTLGFILRFVPSNVPRFSEVRIDWVVLAFALLISILTGLVFGLAPALHSAKGALSSAIREGGRGSGYSTKTGRLRDVLIVSEVAFALILMVGAGLLLRTRSLASRRFSADLVGGFAGLAVLLASIGIYGLLAYMVGQRSREIGVRMALGARRDDILRMFLRKGVALAGMGIVADVAFSASTASMMASLLYGVRPHDPAVFLIVPLLLLAVAALASYLPARRATKVNPIVALRES
jgi:ABC-type antimicrobial peptide transport system permease subunit